MNKAFLVGHLTKDPELKYVNDNTAVTIFTIAVNRSYANPQGEHEADFINCVVWRKPAENVKKYCAKGSLVGVDGSIQTRTYDDKDGKKVYVTEVKADSVSFLDSKKKEEGQAVTPSQFESTTVYSSNLVQDNDFADFGETVEPEDSEIAF